LDVLTTQVTVCIYHAELKSYLLTYQEAKRPEGELTKRGETSMNRIGYIGLRLPRRNWV